MKTAMVFGLIVAGFAMLFIAAWRDGDSERGVDGKATWNSAGWSAIADIGSSAAVLGLMCAAVSGLWSLAAWVTR